MLELDPFPLEGGLLETLHLALKKNKHPPLATYQKLPTRLTRNDLTISHYLRRVRGFSCPVTFPGLLHSPPLFIPCL
jgi:hypothetical protein